MVNTKPDFIIVGAMKGGTSTLAYFLENQNEIVMAPGEVNYFDNDKNFAKGKSWYQKQFKSKDYNRIWGEKTATYHYDEKVPERIYRYNPSTKLVWILRNPIYRAYSNYWHRVKFGGEFNTFEEAVHNEINGIEKNKWGLYLKRSDYANQLKAFNKYFEYKQMYVLIFEDLIHDIRGNLVGLFDFLGVQKEHPLIPPKRSKNVTYLPSSPEILKQSRKIFGKTIPFKIIRKVFEKKTPGYPQLNTKTEEMLKSYFQNSIDELEGIINVDLAIWK
jgi:hypothetical protein